MTYFIIFLLLVILLPAFCLSLALYQKKIHKNSYSFRSYFSYELFPARGEKFFLSLRIVEGLAFSVGFLPGLYGMLSLLQIDENSLFFLIAIMLVGFLPGLGQYFLSFIDLSFAKRHLILFFLIAASMILYTGMTGFYFVAVYRNNLEMVINLLFAIFLFAISLFVALLVINPKITNWDKLEKTIDEKGEISYRRPKRFVLPYSEWMMYFASVLANVIILIGLFMISIK